MRCSLRSVWWCTILTAPLLTVFTNRFIKKCLPGSSPQSYFFPFEINEYVGLNYVTILFLIKLFINLFIYISTESHGLLLHWINPQDVTDFPSLAPNSLPSDALLTLLRL